MITFQVARIKESRINIADIHNRCKGVRLKREKGEIKEGEIFSIPVAHRISHPYDMEYLIIKHKYPKKILNINLVNQLMVEEEHDERHVDWAQVWAGHKFKEKYYALFWFRGASPGQRFPKHRLLLSKCIKNQPDRLKQKTVIPVEYDLVLLRENFGNKIWDQDFTRLGPINRGRISGNNIKNDPLYSEFSTGKNFIGITVEISGFSERVRVISSGRLQFMNCQPVELDNDHTGTILERIIKVVETISPCEK